VAESTWARCSGQFSLGRARPRAAGDRRRLGQLKPDQRIALILTAAGYSYREVGQRRGWTYTYADRCVSEGRAALRKLALASK
jgi:hypothetical protein